MNQTPREFIKDIVLNGSDEERLELFQFDNSYSPEIIAKKFKIFARARYPRYFKSHKADLHDEMVLNLAKSYRNEADVMTLGFRGCAKTVLHKLFLAFVLLNDRDHSKRFIKVLTRDKPNAVQIVTDVYNMVLEAESLYGNLFTQKGAGKTKRQETQNNFTLTTGVKLASGTVGKVQRGHIQDAYRPDWIWFDDVEDRISVSSMAITQTVINNISEAIDGLAKGSSFIVTGNYISDQGTIEWIKQKPGMVTQIIPIADEDLNPTWPAAYTKEEIQKLKDRSIDFFGEFMVDPNRSINKFFDPQRIDRDIKRCQPPSQTSAGVKYWKAYQPNHKYGQGSDHSDGVGLDANTLIGFDFTTGEQIYSYANNRIAPDMAAFEFARVGSEFGNCIYAPEVNNKCGGIVITTLKSSEINYPNLYRHEKIETAKRMKATKWGWETTGSSKRQMLYDFRTDYNDGKIRIHDKDLLKEMKAYSNDDLNDDTVGLVTRHFDLLMAACIAWQMQKHSFKKEDNYDKVYEEYINA